MSEIRTVTSTFQGISQKSYTTFPQMRFFHPTGVIPVQVRIGNTDFKTSLFPKDNLYIVPIKASVRKAENLDEGDEVTIELEIDL